MKKLSRHYFTFYPVAALMKLFAVSPLGIIYYR
jgi:hypothetical protein